MRGEGGGTSGTVTGKMRDEDVQTDKTKVHIYDCTSKKERHRLNRINRITEGTTKYNNVHRPKEKKGLYI